MSERKCCHGEELLSLQRHFTVEEWVFCADLADARARTAEVEKAHAEAVEALRPFAHEAAYWKDTAKDGWMWGYGARITIGDIRRAARIVDGATAATDSYKRGLEATGEKEYRALTLGEFPEKCGTCNDIGFIDALAIESTKAGRNLYRPCPDCAKERP